MELQQQLHQFQANVAQMFAALAQIPGLPVAAAQILHQINIPGAIAANPAAFGAHAQQQALQAHAPPPEQIAAQEAAAEAERLHLEAERLHAEEIARQQTQAHAQNAARIEPVTAVTIDSDQEDSYTDAGLQQSLSASMQPSLSDESFGPVVRPQPRTAAPYHLPDTSGTQSNEELQEDTKETLIHQAALREANQATILQAVQQAAEGQTRSQQSPSTTGGSEAQTCPLGGGLEAAPSG